MNETPTLEERRSRACGTLLGVACGDALGRPVEFRSPTAIDHEYGTLEEMVGNGTHRQPPGTLTDDSDMLLCLARSLVDCERFDPDDIARRYTKWLDGGPFDVGLMTADAIQELRQGASPKWAGKRVWTRSQEGSNAGNGSVMRTAPLALAFHDDPETLATVSAWESQITHYDIRCREGCVVLNTTLAGILDGQDGRDALRDALSDVTNEELQEALEPVANGESDTLALQNTGYIVHTLQTALHDALSADSAEAAIVRSVNRGGDSDTLGAVCGAVAGARFGAPTLPDRWLEHIDEHEELRSLADALVDGAFDVTI